MRHSAADWLIPLSVASESIGGKGCLADDLSDIWRSLIHIHNLGLVARDKTIHRQVVDFCNKYGLPEPIDSGSGRSPSSQLLSNVELEASRMSKAIAGCQQDFIELPEDVQTALDKAIAKGIGRQGRFVCFTLDNVFLAGWFALANTIINKPQGDWGDCDFCGGLKIARAGSRFCSDYCRDRNKKRIARAG